MADEGKSFSLEIITPTREFLSSQVQAVIFECTDGQREVLAGHSPMIAALGIGELKILENGNWRSAFHSEGFIDVTNEKVLLYAQACEWPEEIDVARAEEARQRALEKLRRRQSLQEYRETSISLARAMTRLKVSHHPVN